tara:strand:+ start:6997 stop:7968 length:972 start_codon:yes stop_codon:yes gene_type:complete
LIFNRLKAVWNPELYHGWGKKNKFFEGWYYKIVSKDQDYAFALIPGIAMDENGLKQAFIQILDGKKLKSNYIKFSFDEFKPNPIVHDIKIGNNRFKLNSIELNLPDIKGKLIFRDIVPWSKSFFSPGIMGPFSFLPFMECYHGILSMNHSIYGELTINKKKINFDSGRGYIEKDWGHSFPLGYVWMQSNHFSKSKISFKLSVAKIPMKGFSFIGFIAGVWVNSELIEFTTYNFSNLKKCSINKEEVLIEMDNNKYKLIAKAIRSKSTKLAAPIQGFMDSRIEESMNSKINLVLIDKKNNKSIIDDIGSSSCIEVAGNYSLLLK